MLIFKIKTIAKHLGVHRNTVRNWILKGKLKASPAPAKQYAIEKKEFQAFCKKENISKQIIDIVLISGFEPQEETSANKPLVKIPNEKPLIGAVLVVGGGIAGIHAALELADAGFYVYIVEKTAGIGGTMAQLDKTFPTDDCASCIILPKLVECGRNRNIELLTLSQVESVSGSAGHFKVKVKQKPRYIDTDKCIACGICSQKCPISMDDEFNLNISKKKAVYIKYDQSVPLKYAIDPGACIYFSLGKCKACEKFCPTGAVNFLQTDTNLEIKVGAVILAPGFKPFDPSAHDFYGYPKIRDAVTSMEYERLLSVSGPNRGSLMRPSDNTEPKKIAWILCVGSRNHNGCGNSYCSSICCMASVKQSMASIDHIHGHILDRTIFFMDLRSHGKESEKYFEKAKQEDINFVRAMPHTIEAAKNGMGVRLRYMTRQGQLINETFDMVILSIGFEAPKNIGTLAKKFNIQLDTHNFAQSSCFEPVTCNQKGIYAIGAFQSPKAISRSVVQASAAAASAATLLATKRNTIVKTSIYPAERDITDEKASVGVFVCSCGVNIAGTVDVAKVVEYTAQLPDVTYVENNLFSCSADAQESIIEKIKDFNLNRVVIAACTPRTHEPLFQETLKNAQLNGFMVEMANIRNQNSWVHQEDTVSATYKAKDQVRMAVAKVVHNYPLRQENIRVIQRALVIGGGVTGMNSALTLSDLGIETILVEKGNFLGGNALKLETCFRGEAVGPMVGELIHRVSQDKNITVYMDTTLTSVSGSMGHFEGQFDLSGDVKSLQFGAAIMATGAKEATPQEYLYGQNPRVMTQMEFDNNILYSPDQLPMGKIFVFIQCVGSREPDRPYCSRICCVHSVKTAISLKKEDSTAQVYILFRDIRTYGEWEEYYKEARDLGVMFIQYEVDKKPQVNKTASHLKISTYDPIVRRSVNIHADFLILASGVIANENKNLADLFKFTVNTDGFFNGVHPKLKPVDLSVAGLFLAGICNYPKPLDESIEEARAAAHRAFVLLSQNQIKSEAIKSFVTDQCDGCALCINVCPFHALSISKKNKSNPESKTVVTTDPALCQGCGLCAATCPKDGIMVHGFTKKQLIAQVRAAINPYAR